MCAPLIAHISKYVTLNEADIDLIDRTLVITSLKKRTLILKPGKTCTANYFVVKGCLRLYFISKKDIEQITHFGIENWWLTDYDSLATQKASRFYIQAVEDAEIIALDWRVQEKLTRAIPQLETYFRKIAQHACAAHQRRMEYIYDYTDEERYRNFSKRFPAFIQRVPQYMLASYLGFTPQFLSKIRAKK